MLALLLALLVAAGPLLRGAWDLWSQSLLFLVLTAGSTAWLLGRILAGYIPLPSRRLLVWVGALAAIGTLSARMSPVAVYAIPAWRAQMAAFWVFLALAAVSKDQRSLVDQGVRASAWVLVLLAFYQHYHEHAPRPAASLPNENIFAGVILILLPIAFQKKDWLLCAGLGLCLAWTRSVGAWLGLSAAFLILRREGGPLSYWLGAAIGAACALALAAKFRTPEVLHRWVWWSAAAKLAAGHPWLGAGPGSFAYLWPAYQGAGEFSSLYAHQHILETAAECGLVYTVIWLVGIFHCLRFGGPHKTFAAIAVFIQSLWDYTLSIPALLWLFSYCAASTISESSRGMNVPSRYKLPAALLVLGLGLATGGAVWDQWRAAVWRGRALEVLGASGSPESARALLEKSSALADDPETELAWSEVELREGPPSSPRGRLLAAAAHLERAARLNPYRTRVWTGLERMYAELGLSALAQAARTRGAVFCPILRAPSSS